MDETTPLPSSVVQCLEMAGIARDKEIFYENDQWVYRKRIAQRQMMTASLAKPLESLGPFDIRAVDITVAVSSATETYTMTKIGDQQLATNNQPSGVYSPMAEINLEGFARTAANIPEEATHFCWLYPPFRESIPSDIQFDSAHQSNVLRIGGFAYFRRDHHRELQLLRVNSLVVDGENGLVFDGPFPWHPQYTKELWQQKRFQPVTLPSLREKGARYFAFLNPNESVNDENLRMPWTPSSYGAFAYLYNDDHSAHEYDCYFTVADSCLGVSAADDC